MLVDIYVSVRKSRAVSSVTIGVLVVVCDLLVNECVMRGREKLVSIVKFREKNERPVWRGCFN